MKTPSLVITGQIKLKRFSPDDTDNLDKDDAKKITEDLCRQIGDQQELLYANSNHAVLLLFQGMDASGKDGAIRSVLHHVNPAGVQTANFKVPSAEEKAHDFLWRVHHAVPRYGNIGVFNRSHYEAVLAERVFKLTPRSVWSARYAQIVDFEKMLRLNNVVLLKFFLHISR
jgi:polyphosphate kinase 2 (PPK2 family)